MACDSSLLLLLFCPYHFYILFLLVCEDKSAKPSDPIVSDLRERGRCGLHREKDILSLKFGGITAGFTSKNYILLFLYVPE